MAKGQTRIDGFLLPGHVSVIIGLQAYDAFWQQYRIPCVVGGFEPVDILEGLLQLIRQIESGHPQLANAYPRVVTHQGNPKAREAMARVFEPCDARWRGIGVIGGSGLAVREEFAAFDALRRFDLEIVPAAEPRGCACGEILTGSKTPPQCALFRSSCTPMTPVGPCMVSSEGTCAAYYRYHEE
jgi:hydrogenase expression/formation protein HypD